MQVMQCYGYENPIHSQNNLLNTIELPRNLRYLQNKLPKAKYNEPDLSNLFIDESKSLVESTKQNQQLNEQQQSIEQPLEKQQNSQQLKESRPLSSEYQRGSQQININNSQQARPLSQAVQLRRNQEPIVQSQKIEPFEKKYQQSQIEKDKIRQSIQQLKKEKQEQELKHKEKELQKYQVHVPQKAEINYHNKENNKEEQEKKRNYEFYSDQRTSQQSPKPKQDGMNIKEYWRLNQEEKSKQIQLAIEQIQESKEEKQQVSPSPVNKVSLDNKYSFYYQQYLQKEQQLVKNIKEERMSQQLEKAKIQDKQLKENNSCIEQKKFLNPNYHQPLANRSQLRNDSSRIQRIFSAKVRYDYNDQNTKQTQQKLQNEYKANLNALNVIQEENQTQYYQNQYKKFQEKNSNLRQIQKEYYQKQLSSNNQKIQINAQHDKMQMLSSNQVDQLIRNDSYKQQSNNLQKKDFFRIFSGVPNARSNNLQNIQQQQQQQNKNSNLQDQKNSERSSHDFMLIKKLQNNQKNNQVVEVFPRRIMPRIQSAQVNEPNSNLYLRKYLPQPASQQYPQINQYQLGKQYGKIQNYQSNYQHNYKLDRERRNVQSAQQNLRQQQSELQRANRQQRGLNIINCFNVNKHKYI